MAQMTALRRRNGRMRVIPCSGRGETTRPDQPRPGAFYRAELILDLRPPGSPAPLSPNRGLNRIVGPAPALRQSLRAASASLGRGLSAALAASRFRQPASPRARDAIPPCERVWSRNRQQHGVGSRPGPPIPVVKI